MRAEGERTGEQVDACPLRDPERGRPCAFPNYLGVGVFIVSVRRRRRIDHCLLLSVENPVPDWALIPLAIGSRAGELWKEEEEGGKRDSGSTVHSHRIIRVQTEIIT